MYCLDPLTDPRWPEFLASHARASVFHARPWLEALRATFGFEPVVYTTTGPGDALANALLLCRVRSSLTGDRLVSLPFSDHCEPLFDTVEEFEAVAGAVARENAGKARYVELRPRTDIQPRGSGFSPARPYWFHVLSLSATTDELYRGLHRDCVRRKIQRAERERLDVECGTSQKAINEFYDLMLPFRRRLGMPPLPGCWFGNLVNLHSGNLQVRIARKSGEPVAAIMTARFKDVVTYKYGCSDPARNSLGGMPLLLWEAIREARENGMREFDFGRSDYDNTGLAVFKDRWNCVRSTLRYWRSPASSVTQGDGWAIRVGRAVLPCVPASLLPPLGKLVARHLA